MRAYLREMGVALAAVRDASRAASSLQRQIVKTQAASWKPETVEGQGFGVSPVTAADFLVQVLVLSSLSSAFPQDRFIAEETSKELLAAGDETRAAVLSAVHEHGPRGAGLIGEAEALAALDLGGTGAVDGWSRQGRTWVLDPVDGTKGFLRGDQFAVALSLLDGGEPVVACLGCPNIGERGSLFFGARGEGARRGDVFGPASEAYGAEAGADALAAACPPMRVSDEAVGAGLVRCEAYEPGHSNHTLAERVASRLGCTDNPPIRIDGQGKYGLLAAGEAHVFTRLPGPGYVENIWDVSAGALIVEEAGGRVSDLDGRPIDFSLGSQLDASVRGIVATNGVVHDAVLEALAAERQ
jgi:HAL2 family 3'(2'),5'-bisphosphate nucleotidase